MQFEKLHMCPKVSSQRYSVNIKEAIYSSLSSVSMEEHTLKLCGIPTCKAKLVTYLSTMFIFYYIHPTEHTYRP